MNTGERIATHFGALVPSSPLFLRYREISPAPKRLQVPLSKCGQPLEYRAGRNRLLENANHLRRLSSRPEIIESTYYLYYHKDDRYLNE